MPVLASQQRKILEDACTKGRRASERAVQAALTSLAITADRPPAHLNDDDRQLRSGLRAKARQLGDKGDDLDLLVAECAYEQWHRLLFARFLAENNLLIHPEYHAPVTLEDCDELAGSLGEPDGWSVAARFAAEILPGIFQLDDPCVRLRLTPEGRLALESIVADLPGELFAADDALGWVYQFWQKDKKDEVNDAERKIDGADLGPVTQLFTENYMVRFLLENSLGAWWAVRHPDSPLLKSFEYLRLNDDGTPASGAFDHWPDRVAELTVIDPCCGSGHFLVEALSLLAQMRAEEEGLAPTEAQDAALRDNLFGLELDPRCVQIAMFAVALHAWKTGGAWRSLPVPNIACSGVPVHAPVEEWKALAQGDQRIESALVRLHVLFREADTLGSLIEPQRSVEVLDPTGLQRSFEDVEWDVVAPLLAAAAEQERADPATRVLGVAAAGIARSADLLSRTYVLVATNVPYLHRQYHGTQLRSHLDRFFGESRADLATAFVMRALRMAPKGTVAAVTPENWTYLVSYAEFRAVLLKSTSLHWVARLGPGAFAGITGEVVKALLLIVSSGRVGSSLGLLDCAGSVGPVLKAQSLRESLRVEIPQTEQARHPDCIITFSKLGEGELLERRARGLQGLSTGDNARFVRFIWELPGRAVAEQSGWQYLQSAPTETSIYSGRQEVVRWGAGRGSTEHENLGAIRGRGGWGKRGVALARAGSLPATLYTGELFVDSAAVVVPTDQSLVPALWHYCSSVEYSAAVRQLNTKLIVANATLVKVPFEIERWRLVADKAGPLPEPWSKDPTQWLFTGRPEESTDPLQVAVARLVGYGWPEQPESDNLHSLEDTDGIVCLPSVAGEPAAADRLLQVLGAAFGPSWSPAQQKELLEGTGSKKRNFSDWLRDDFFKQHCALFGHRPFVWHIWDGQRDGFAALVNYHRLDRKTLEKLTYSYLGDWIERQRAEVREDKAGAEARLTAASKLRSSLELILDGEPPYDIYVRWKSLAEQPIGWDPDVNDGVRVNVRPFVEAGVLRASFNIHWGKDRGKNPNGSERLNDLHLTTAKKRAARGDSG